MKMAFLMALALPGMLLAAPEVTDVTVAENRAGHSLTVEYVLKDEAAVITFEVETNGVPLKVGYAHATGAVNHLVQPGEDARTFTWQTDVDWPGHLLASPESVTVKVRAWPKDDPPDYMMLSLIRPPTGSETKIAPLYYAKVEDVPGGITDIRWKTEWLAMRRIHARGANCRLGTERDDISYGNPAIGNTTSTAHPVAFTKDFYIGVYEFTQAQYMLAAPPALGGTTLKTFADAVFLGKDQAKYDAYVNATNDYDRTRAACGPSLRYYLIGNALDYCWPEGETAVSSALLFGKLRALTGISSLYLPTSDQWEFACRAGCDGRVCNGAGSIADVGWCKENNEEDPDWLEGLAHAVGLKQPNAWGLYDMHGNALEWCCDNYSATPQLNADGSPVVDPKGPATTLALANVQKTQCGGDFTLSDAKCGAAVRVGNVWGSAYENWGIRFICDAEVVK